MHCAALSWRKESKNVKRQASGVLVRFHTFPLMGSTDVPGGDDEPEYKLWKQQ